MKSFFFSGKLLDSTMVELKKIFSNYGFELRLNNELEINFPQIILVDNIAAPKRSAAGKNPVLGFAMKEKRIAYVTYPAASSIYCSCVEEYSFINSDKLFALTCIHEAMHLLGLSHCKNKGCIMAKLSCKSASSGYCLQCLSTKRQKTSLCNSCSKKIQELTNN